MLPWLSSKAPLGYVNPSVEGSSEVIVFTSVERVGVTVMAIAGVTSCSLVSLLLLYIIISAAAVTAQRPSERPDMFIRKQIAVFLTCLLVSDLIQSVAGLTQLKWALENRIYTGRSCTIQAAALVMGDLGSTFWSVVIASHTFSGIAMNRHWPRWVMWVLVCTGWLFVIILSNGKPFPMRRAPFNSTTAFLIPLGIVSAEKGPFFSIAGTWCFISSEYAVPRLLLHYIPLFLASSVILTLYVLIFFFLRGSIHFLPAEGPSFHLDDVHSRQRVAIAKRMLWYPVAYITCVLPISITRVIAFHFKNVPEAAWIVGNFFLFSLGAVDSVIYASTRTVLRPWNISLRLSSFGSSGVNSGTSMLDNRSQGGQNIDYFGQSERVAGDGGLGIHVTQERTEEVYENVGLGVQC
ncbi:hypothetical protein K439DRAFT_1662820 [Ramaria rubella]|nr:hypothetical protein K439DRAFT_1662820 [Ramaria rubella]